MKLYRTVIRQTVIYGLKAVTLITADISILQVFEWKIIRKYGPVIQEEIWRTRDNYDINTISKGGAIVIAIDFLSPDRLVS